MAAVLRELPKGDEMGEKAGELEGRNKEQMGECVTSISARIIQTDRQGEGAVKAKESDKRRGR